MLVALCQLLKKSARRQRSGRRRAQRTNGTNSNRFRLLWRQGLAQELLTLHQRPINYTAHVQVQDIEDHVDDL